MGIAVPFILVQKSLRRMLAYSSIDHAGIMTVALGIGGPLASLGLMLHMTFHTIAKSLLFLCAGNVYQHCKTDLFQKIAGVIRSMPLTGIILLMGVLAVTGVPPFSLFVSEFLIVRAALENGHVLPAVMFVLFAVGVFTGAILQSGRLLLGTSEHTVAGGRPWRNGTIFAIASVLVVIGFWIPAPLMDLIRGAAKVVSQ
jgi:hydrogenase-4 component F